jgi:hypothetical protein
MEENVKEFVINVGDDSDEETKFQIEFHYNETFNDRDSSSIGEPL